MIDKTLLLIAAITLIITWYLLYKSYTKKRGIKDRSAFFTKAIVWTLFVSGFLFSPYIFSSIIDLVIYTTGEPSETFISCFMEKINRGIETGAFLFIPVGLSSSAYIDYMFNKEVKIEDNYVHVPFWILVVIVGLVYACVDLKSSIAQINDIKINDDIVSMFVIWLFVFSIIYSTGIKWYIFSQRKIQST